MERIDTAIGRILKAEPMERGLDIRQAILGQLERGFLPNIANLEQLHKDLVSAGFTEEEIQAELDKLEADNLIMYDPGYDVVGLPADMEHYLRGQ